MKQNKGFSFFFLLFVLILLSCQKKDNISLMSKKDVVFTQYFQTQKGWVSGDGTASIPLKDGKVLWIMGDSGLDSWKAPDSVKCLFQIRNCALLQSGNTFKTIVDSVNTQKTYFKVTGKNHTDEWYWPMHGYHHQDFIYVFLEKFLKQPRANSSLAFTSNGYSIAKLKYSLGQIQSLEYINLPANNNISFGNSIILDEANNQIYLYGNKQNGFGFDLYLAKSKPADVLTNLEYYNNGKWSKNSIDATKINKDFTISPDFSISKINNKYLLIYQQIGLKCNEGREIYAMVSDKLEGDFQNKKTIWTIDDSYKNQTLWTYGGKAHPEFTSNNELLVSYNVNGIGSCGSVCGGSNIFTSYMPAYTYRPKFIRVPLGLIDNLQIL